MVKKGKCIDLFLGLRLNLYQAVISKRLKKLYFGTKTTCQHRILLIISGLLHFIQHQFNL